MGHINGVLLKLIASKVQFPVENWAIIALMESFAVI